MVKITIQNVSFSYGSNLILNDLNLVVGDSEILGLVGPNGSGKTTLIKSIDRILKPRGSILLDGRDLSSMEGSEIAREIGYVPQSGSSAMGTTVFETILMGRRPHISWRVSDRDLEIVTEVIELLHLEDLAMRDFGQLSGGQKQKVLIARALAQEPSVLLLDEPTSNLDMKHQLEVMEIIREMVQRKSISAVMAVHDLNLAARFVDKLAVLKNGRIWAAGDASSLLTPDIIREVYSVEAVVMQLERPFVIPIRSLNGGMACE